MNKNYFLGLAAVSLLLVSLSSCTHAETTADVAPSIGAIERRHPAGTTAQRLAVLPDQASWDSLYSYADNLDLNSGSISLQLHGGSGTSVYAVVSENGKPVGALLPENSGASVTGETISFTIARALGIVRAGEIATVQPAVYKRLTGSNLTKFMTIVPATRMPTAAKELNRTMILQRYAKDRTQMDAVFKRWDAKPNDFIAIVGKNESLSSSFVLPGSSAPIASLINCRGPQPEAGRQVQLNGGHSTELEAARQLSNILLIDALTSQWDRFSGGNLQTIKQGEQSLLVAFDNGGTWNTSATAKNLRYVTRFDRSVAERILSLADFVERGIPFMGLRTDQEMMSAFDVAQAPKAYAKFKANIIITAAHIRANQGCYF